MKHWGQVAPSTMNPLSLLRVRWPRLFYGLIAVLFVLSLVSLTVAQTDPPEYRDGMFCSPKGDIIGPLHTSNHPCTCHRISYDKDCENNLGHDVACNQYCHEKHCACPPAGCQPVPPAADDADR